MMNHLIQELREDPPWRAIDVGKPLPRSPYAVSVCLPTWESVIAYERSESRVVDKMQSGYPRFFVASHVSRLASEILQAQGRGSGEVCYVYPNETCARRCLDFIRKRCSCVGRIAEHHGVWSVFASKECAATAKAYWQHSGEGISARHAASVLGESVPTEDGAEAEVRQRLARIYSVAPESVFLFSSGMAAIWSSIRFFDNQQPAASSIQFGFPYVDTLKLLQYRGDCHFLPHGSETDVDKVESLVKAGPIGSLFCEAPSNPLLRTPNVLALSTILRSANVPFVIDETLAACGNLELLPHCDAVICSLTKYFSGVGDVMGGAVIVNANTSHGSALKRFLQSEVLATPFEGDMTVLATNSRNLDQRTQRINENGLALAEFLSEHSAPAAVFHPAISVNPNYERLRKKEKGYGGLLSFVLKRADAAPLVFNNMQCCKGPNLGMEYTLACPFTLLAHFNELDFAEDCGLSRYLIRVSVGTEEKSDLIARFEDALGGALL